MRFENYVGGIFFPTCSATPWPLAMQCREVALSRKKWLLRLCTPHNERLRLYVWQCRQLSAKRGCTTREATSLEVCAGLSYAWDAAALEHAGGSLILYGLAAYYSRI